MTTTPKDPVDALMELVVVYAQQYHNHRTMPRSTTSPAFDAARAAVEASARALAAVPASREYTTPPERLHEEIEMLRAQLANARERIERSHQILMGIYTLLDPMCVQADGKTWVFKNPDAQEVLRLLSERIRAVPDQIAAPSPSAVQPLSEAPPKDAL